ncbi:hypothetical protein FQR65_LT16500 [Abscondita terminalis]|nr:hypothetical protein FQR65_LT16500 [Abscondita terminalis]
MLVVPMQTESKSTVGYNSGEIESGDVANCPKVKIEAAKYARENNIPVLGICLGMQIMTIEFARNVLGVNNANSTEFDLMLNQSGKNPETGLVEALELKNHPFYVGVQYHPEYKSTVANPHPLFKALVEAAAGSPLISFAVFSLILMGIMFYFQSKQNTQARTGGHYRQFSPRYQKSNTEQLQNNTNAAGEMDETQENLNWIGVKQQFFSAVIEAQNGFKNSKGSQETIEKGEYLKRFNYNGQVDLAANELNQDFKWYFMPLDLNLLKSYDKNFDEILP